MRLKNILLPSVAAMVIGCSSSGAKGEQPYQVGVGSAIYAGSSIPKDKTVVSLELYFGHHIVRGGSGGRGCCYATAVGYVNSGKPRGGVVALWEATEYGDEKLYLDRLDTWIDKPVRKRFFYAVAQPSRLAPYPEKVKGHRFYGVYVSAGRVIVNQDGLDSGNSVDATAVAGDAGKPLRYVIGKDDTVYYKILSRGPGAGAVASAPSPWYSIPGVSLTEEQYRELDKCDFNEGCRSFLSLTDADLTKEQREYVRQNPISLDDMKYLIRDLKRSRRQHERWL